MSGPELAYQFPVDEDRGEYTVRDRVNLSRQPSVSAMKKSSHDAHVREYSETPLNRTPEMRMPHYSGYFKLSQWCPV